MSKIKIGFSGLDVPNQIDRSRRIQVNMTGNPDYVTPVPTLLQIKNATDALEAAYSESRARDRIKIQIMRLRRADLLALIVQLAAYVQSTSGGDADKILGSGFDVIAKGVPVPLVGQVLNLRLSQGDEQAAIKVLWDKMPGAHVYVVEISPDPFSNDSFDPKAVSTKTRAQLKNLTTGAKYWVRVAAIGKDNIGTWSDPASKIAE